MTHSEWLKFYDEAMMSYSHGYRGTLPMPTFEEFRAQQAEFMRQCANQPLGDLSKVRGL